MRYLVTTSEYYSPFFTDWFDAENHFNPDLNMIVYDMLKCKFTTDGVNWYDINIDRL